MLALAAQRHDLAPLPLTQVLGIANTIAAEVSLSPGTARRVLLAHVRSLQNGHRTDQQETTPTPARSWPPAPNTTSSTPPSTEDATVSGWLLVSGLEFAPLPTAVPCARLHTRFRLAEWNLSHMTEAAELIVSELLTNALTATQALRFLAPGAAMGPIGHLTTPDPDRRRKPSPD